MWALLVVFPVPIDYFAVLFASHVWQCFLKLLDPVGTVVELWDIKGCFLTNAAFGDLSYEDEAPTEISLTLRFDNCVLQY